MTQSNETDKELSLNELKTVSGAGVGPTDDVVEVDSTQGDSSGKSTRKLPAMGTYYPAVVCVQEGCGSNTPIKNDKKV